MSTQPEIVKLAEEISAALRKAGLLNPPGYAVHITKLVADIREAFQKLHINFPQ